MKTLLFYKRPLFKQSKKGFPGGSVDKQSACNASKFNLGSTRVQPLGLGRSPGGGNGNPLQYSCLGNLMYRGAGGLQSMGSQRVTHNLSDWVHTRSPLPADSVLRSSSWATVKSAPRQQIIFSQSKCINTLQLCLVFLMTSGHRFVIHKITSQSK